MIRNRPSAPRQQLPKVLFVATTVLFFKEFLLPFAQHFRRLGWQVDGAGGMNRGWEEAEQVFDHVYEIEMSRDPRNPAKALQGMRQLRELVEREGYQIVHVHTPIAGFVARLALRGLQRQGRVKVIYTSHGFHFHPQGNPLKNAAFYAFEKAVTPWTDFLVTMNRHDEQAAWNLVGRGRTVYMPGIGVDLSYYSGKGLAPEQVRAVRRELGLESDTPMLLMIAEFNPGKRHKDALEAFAAMRDKRAHLVFAGVGPLEGEVARQAQELGVAERVHQLGWRKDIPALIAASDALLLPSEREGLPRAIMESMCMGKPVIGTRIRGIEDLVGEDGGLLTPVGDVPALAAAMDKIVGSPALAQQMGRRGKERIKQYDLEHILRLHEELYAKALGGSVKSLVKT